MYHAYSTDLGKEDIAPRHDKWLDTLRDPVTMEAEADKEEPSEWLYEGRNETWYKRYACTIVRQVPSSGVFKL